MKIDKSKQKELQEIVTACEYWANQKRHCQEMIILADKNLANLEKKFKELNESK